MMTLLSQNMKETAKQTLETHNWNSEDAGHQSFRNNNENKEVKVTSEFLEMRGRKLHVK